MVYGFGSRASVFGFRFLVFGFRFSVFGFRFSGFGFRISGSGFWVQNQDREALRFADCPQVCNGHLGQSLGFGWVRRSQTAPPGVPALLDRGTLRFRREGGSTGTPGDLICVRLQRKVGGTARGAIAGILYPLPSTLAG